jgi:hypothetical protein
MKNWINYENEITFIVFKQNEFRRIWLVLTFWCFLFVSKLLNFDDWCKSMQILYSYVKMAQRKLIFTSDTIRQLQFEAMKAQSLRNFGIFDGFSWKWRAFMISLNQPLCFCSCQFTTIPTYYAVNYFHFYKNIVSFLKLFLITLS